MNSKINLKWQKALFLMFCFLSVLQLNAQDKTDKTDKTEKKDKKEKIQYNKYENEIGIDMQGIFRGTLGTSIVYKKRIGERKYISINEKKVVRFRIGGSGNVYLGDDLESVVDSVPTFYYSGLIRDGFQFHGLAGMEWQKQVNRVQYFYGFEAGFQYGKYHLLTGRIYSSVDGTTYIFDDEITVSVPFIGLGGVKYFISPFFSISLETNFQVAYQREMIKRNYRNSNPQPLFERTNIDFKINRLDFNFDYLSTLNVSYYF